MGGRACVDVRTYTCACVRDCVRTFVFACVCVCAYVRVFLSLIDIMLVMTRL